MKAPKFSLLFLLSLVFFASCERDILVFRNHQLKGKWRWIETTTSDCYNHCTTYVFNTNTPQSTGNEMILDFKTRGVMVTKLNGDITKREKINLTHKNFVNTNGVLTLFYFTGEVHSSNSDWQFNGSISGNMDTLIIRPITLGTFSSTSKYVRIE